MLVTGATGFLGRALVPRLLASGATVTVHGRATASPFAVSLEHVRGDLVDPLEAERLLSPWRWDAVVNLAGPVSGGSEVWATGVAVVHAHAMIALNLRRLAAEGTRIVHTSSMTVYGDPQASPIDEQHPRLPRHLYGLAKSVAEDVWLSALTLDTWVLRLPGLFSEHRRSGALYHFCRAARAGEVVKVSAPEPTPWDLLHVDDAALAITSALAAQPPGGQAINISYGQPVELSTIARWIADHAGAGSTVEQLPGVTHPVFCLDVTKARTRLGWAPPQLHDRLAALFAAYGADAR